MTQSRWRCAPVALAAAVCVASVPVLGQTGLVNWESPHVNPIALTPSGATLLAVNTPDNRLEVFDVASGLPVHAGSITVGLDPVSVRARNESEVWVVNHVSDSISIVDLASGRVTRTILTGDEPTDVVFAGNPQRAFVSVSQLNQVRVFDPANLGELPIVIAIQGEDPRALAVDAAGTTVYVGIFESANQTTIVDRQVVSAPTGPYGGLNPPPNAGNQFSPPITPGLPAPPPVAQIVRQNAAGEWRDGNNRNWSNFITWGLHDQDVAMIDATTLGVTYARGLMTTVMNLAVSPAGAVTAVGTEAHNEIRFEPNVDGIFIRAEIASFNPATPALVSIADLNPHLNYSAPSVRQAVRDQSIGDPRGIAWHPSGSKVYVAGMGSNSVIATDATGARLAAIGVGQGPSGLAISAAGERLYVLNKFSGSVSVIDTAANAEVARVPFYDPSPPAIKLGRPLLYDTHLTSGLGQASCAGCHVDGRTDGLAWDLGNPAGPMKVMNQTCRQGPGNCADWHPMKGPMVTQTLVGIVGVEPFHWRGDRENLAAFAPAFTGLQGAGAEPSAGQMQQMTDFVATLHFPPNPNRNLDGTLPAVLATQTGNGNAANGMNIFQNQPILGGMLRCVACHALPTGTDQTIDFPNLAAAPQSLKIAHLRNMHEKTGFSRMSLTNNRGFGFNHDSDRDTLFTLLSGPGFTFPPGPPGQQQRRDLEAFMLCLTTDTHPAVGQQVTFNGSNNSDLDLFNRYSLFVSLANSGQVGLVVKGRQGGIERGYVYQGSNVFQSDRAGQTIAADALRASATAGGELTYTVVPIGTQRRIGIDRDADTFLDRDELDAGSDPADPNSTPVMVCDADGLINLADGARLVGCLTGPTGALGVDCTCSDRDHNGSVDLADVGAFAAAFTGP